MVLAWLDISASHAHTSLALPAIHAAGGGVDGVTWRRVAGTLQADPGSVAAELHDLRPDLIAATLYLFNRRHVLDTLARAKALLPDCSVLVGGPECLGNGLAALLRDHPWVDVAVRGEGEAVMPEILRRCQAGQALAGISGVVCRQPGGEIADAGSTAVRPDWASLPPPCASPFFDTSKPFVQIETSRGCDRRCSFCTSGGQSPVRYRALSAVREELTALRRAGVRQIRVIDRTFNTPPERAEALLVLFLGEFSELCFHLEIHPGMLPPALRRLLAAAPPGRLHIEAGLQSTSAAALAAVQRYGDPAAALDGIGFLAGCRGFETHVDLLAGLPGQTWAQLLDDARAAIAAGPAEIQLEILKALPGTPFRDHAGGLGVAWSPVPPYEVLRTADLGPAALRQAARLSRLLDRFHNAPPLRACFRAVVGGDPGFLEAALAGLGDAGLLDAPATLERRFGALGELVRQRCPEHADALRWAWISAGLPPQDPFCGAVPWKTAIPAEASWELGDSTCQRRRHARTWHLPLDRGDGWAVFDRTQDPRCPIGAARRGGNP